MTRKMLHIKKGQVVRAMCGDDKGAEGKVLAVFPEKDTALVEGLNFMRKHVRPSESNPEGGIVEREAPIHVSNLKPVDGGDKE